MLRSAIVMFVVFGVHGLAHAEGNADRGMVDFVKNCSSCHSIQAGSNAIGPSLNGIVGRRAGTAMGYAYSAELAKGDFDWNEPVLLEYLTSPTQGGGGDQPLHSVHMHFDGLSSGDAEDIVAFLRAVSRQ